MADHALEPKLPEALRAAEELPSLPAVALEVLRLTEDRDATLDDLARVLSMDPALAARLLKLANSPLFGLGSEVATLQRACMVLGLRTVKLMALSFSLVGTLRRPVPGPLDTRQFWHRSLLCAAAARSLASAAGIRLRDEAFLCGLLAHIGQLVLAQCAPAEYRAVTARAGDAWPTPELEREILGYDSFEIGGALLRSWSLPRMLCDGVRLPMSPERFAAEDRGSAAQLVRIVHVALRVEALACGPDARAARKELEASAADRLALSPEKLREMLDGLDADLKEVGRILSVEVDPLDMEDILRRAQSEIIKASLGVATEARLAKRRLSALQREKETLARQVLRDPLTGLANREAFERGLDACIRERGEGDRPGRLGLLMVDIDRFKEVNDRLGHPAGDAVLRAVGKALTAVVRGTDFPARYGGEEFAVVMPETTAAGLEAVAHRVRLAVERCVIDVGGRTTSVTVSVGGASLATIRSGDDRRALVAAADECLYQAKVAGRNRCVVRPESVT
jgi:diguanylate cyclase (GGDEF)-like protein